MNLFVSVGTSALNRERVSGKDLDALKAVFEIAKQGRIPSEATLRAVREPLVRYHASYWADQQRRFKKLPETSAELASSFLFVKNERDSGQCRIDNVVLLASQTELGRLAAEVNLGVFEKYRSSDLLGPDTAVRLEVVDELDLNFQDVEAGLSRRLAPFFRDGQHCVFNYTGGFKGAVPSVTLLAKQHGWRLYYQHETSLAGYVLDFSDGRVTPSWRIHGRQE